jgi:plastocyanin
MRIMPGWLWPVGLVAALACGDDDSSGPDGGPDGAPDGSTVTVGDNFFQPASVTVSRTGGAGGVVWNWTGNNPHNVTFDAGPPNSQTQTSGSFSRSFSEAGSFSYYCTVHGRSMSGTVSVE